MISSNVCMPTGYNFSAAIDCVLGLMMCAKLMQKPCKAKIILEKLGHDKPISWQSFFAYARVTDFLIRYLSLHHDLCGAFVFTYSGFLTDYPLTFSENPYYFAPLGRTFTAKVGGIVGKSNRDFCKNRWDICLTSRDTMLLLHSRGELAMRQMTDFSPKTLWRARVRA